MRSKNVEKSTRESVYLCTRPVRIVTLRESIRRRSNAILRSLIFVSQQQVAVSLCSSLCSRRVLETSDEAGHGDCRFFRTTKNPTMKTFTKVTMSMRTKMTTVQHRVLRTHTWRHPFFFFSLSLCMLRGTCVIVSTKKITSPFSTVQLVCVQSILRS